MRIKFQSPIQITINIIMVILYSMLMALGMGILHVHISFNARFMGSLCILMSIAGILSLVE